VNSRKSSKCGQFVLVILFPLSDHSWRTQWVERSKFGGIMNKKNVIMTGIIGWSLAGCATVINGTSQDYQIRSDPDGARASVSGTGVTCTTPCEISLKRGEDQRIDIAHEGYQSEYVLVQSRTGGAMAGNLLLGGLVGGVVDGATGASNHLYPRPLHLRLVANNTIGEAELLDENGAVMSTLQAHNDAVREDVAETIGAQAAEYTAPAAEGN
jgi:PEGA domain